MWASSEHISSGLTPEWSKKACLPATTHRSYIPAFKNKSRCVLETPEWTQAGNKITRTDWFLRLSGAAWSYYFIDLEWDETWQQKTVSPLKQRQQQLIKAHLYIARESMYQESHTGARLSRLLYHQLWTDWWELYVRRTLYMRQVSSKARPAKTSSF